MLTVVKQKSGQIKFSILIRAFLRAKGEGNGEQKSLGKDCLWQGSRHRTTGYSVWTWLADIKRERSLSTDRLAVTVKVLREQASLRVMVDIKVFSLNN